MSPRKTSTVTTRLLATPVSNSPSKTSTSSYTHFPPAFDQALHHTSSRYPAQQYTPYSPYRPGEYGRSERGLTVASDRTKIERRLFEGEDNEDELLVPRAREDSGSSPLAPAFEAKMVLRNGASVDLISWYVDFSTVFTSNDVRSVEVYILLGFGKISITYQNPILSLHHQYPSLEYELYYWNVSHGYQSWMN